MENGEEMGCPLSVVRMLCLCLFAHEDSTMDVDKFLEILFLKSPGIYQCPSGNAQVISKFTLLEIELSVEYFLPRKFPQIHLNIFQHYSIAKILFLIYQNHRALYDCYTRS